MTLGTESPNIYPTDRGPFTSTGATYVGMEARAGKILNMYLTEHTDTFTIVAAAPVVGDLTFEADATHTITAGDMVELYEDDVYFQALVTLVAVDTISIDTPIPYAFTVAGAAGINGPRNAAVVGSAVAPVIYELAPPTGQVWDITKLMFYIEGDTAAMTHSLFGDIAALVNGMVLRVKRSADKYESIANFKANVDFSVNSFDTEVSATMTAASFGEYSSKTFGNEGESGAVIRLDGTAGETLEVVVRDDLTTLVLVKTHAHGYFLDEE